VIGAAFQKAAPQVIKSQREFYQNVSVEKTVIKGISQPREN
jgi:hypothetical protein